MFFMLFHLSPTPRQPLDPYDKKGENNSSLFGFPNSYPVSTSKNNALINKAKTLSHLTHVIVMPSDAFHAFPSFPHNISAIKPI